MDEEKKETSPKSSNTTMYLVFVIILLVAVSGAYYFGRKSGEAKEMVLINSMPKSSGFSGPRPSGPPSMKGQKFSDTPLFSQAVQIYPGTISESAKATMTGWNLATKTLPDGTTQADLIPVGSEATEGDTAHTFILKNTDKLYFVDLNPNDDKPGMDENTHDDLGIVVSADGIVQ